MGNGEYKAPAAKLPTLDSRLYPPRRQTLLTFAAMPASLAYYWFRFRSALRWYLRAGTRYDVHSPRLFDFVRKVYDDDRHFHLFDLVSSIRAYWSRREGNVRLQSLGAPSKTTHKQERTVSSLVDTNAIAPQEGELLFRLALWLRADHILEFGTNAGISTLYLHGANTEAHLYTVEGNPEVAALARETFDKAGVGPRLQAFNDRFDHWLTTQWPTLGASSGPLDLFFLDGDHRHQPTLNYVRTVLPYATAQSVFVIADIHWSEGMELAWEELKAFPEVSASLDLYHFGLLFFDPGMDGPHQTLAPTWMKPWRMGFFS